MHKHSNTIKQKDVILWINIVLLGMVSLLVFYYVMTANTIASKNYKIQALQDKIEHLAEVNGELMTKKVLMEAPNVLMEFAQARSLVEAGNISYIFENKDVAKR